MLSLQNKQLNSIFERIVYDKNGVLVRVRFTVVEVDGVFKGQVVSIEPVVSNTSSSKYKKPTEPICLACIKDNKDFSLNLNTDFESIISPYFSLEFFMSQPTRAPAFK